MNYRGLYYFKWNCRKLSLYYFLINIYLNKNH